MARHRRELFVHCYRMAGSLEDAEDLVQEVMLRAWRRRDQLGELGSVRAWLYRIATNVCLDALRARARRTLPSEALPAASPEGDEPSWLDPVPNELLAGLEEDPEQRYTTLESVRLAFLVAIHTLPPRQRAALILCDVLGYRPGEVASLLGVSIPAASSLLHRARSTMASRYAGEDVGAPADPATEDLLDRYVRAWETSDVDALVGLLREDATFSMPPVPEWYRGPEAIGAIGRRVVFADGRYRLSRTGANGGPAFVVERAERGGPFAHMGLQLVVVRGGLVSDVVTYMDPGLTRWFRRPPPRGGGAAPAGLG